MEFEIKLAYLFELTNGFKDWGSLTTTGKKQAYKNFEEAARSIDNKRVDVKHQRTESNDFLKELDQMYKKGLI
jgi:hypothetical protein